MEMLPLAAPPDAGLNWAVKARLCAGASVTGVETPLTEKPVPLAVTCETVTLALPVFLTVTLCEAELPTFTLPKLTLAGVAESVELAVTPVPLNAIEAGEFGALLTSARLPLSVPADRGANCTLKLLLCPGRIVSGVESPLLLNPLPVSVAWLIVRFAVPVFVRVTLCDFVWPSTTLPKLMLAGEMLNPACVPAPDSARAVGEPCASLRMDTLPLAAPADPGAYFTCNVTEFPGFKVAGAVRPLTVNPDPVTFTCEMLAAACPEFVSVEVSVLLPPTATFPKFRLAGLSVSCPTGAVVAVPESRIVAGDFESLLVITTDPELLPALDGA